MGIIKPRSGHAFSLHTCGIGSMDFMRLNRTSAGTAEIIERVESSAGRFSAFAGDASQFCTFKKDKEEEVEKNCASAVLHSPRARENYGETAREYIDGDTDVRTLWKQSWLRTQSAAYLERTIQTKHILGPLLIKKWEALALWTGSGCGKITAFIVSCMCRNLYSYPLRSREDRSGRIF